VRARWPGLAALVVALAAASGCAGGGAAGSDDAAGGQLTVYSSLPLQGATAEISEQTSGGEKLALADARGRAGHFRIGYVSLDDSNPTSGQWNPGVTATNAKNAAQDTSTIAYIGDFESAATAISLPLINAAGIPQVSPASPYVGLTQSLDAGQDEPERFYPSGKRTFARVVPGDPVEADAVSSLLRSLGVHRVYMLDDGDPFAIPLVELLASDAEHAGITVAGHDSLSIVGGGVYKGEAEKVAASGAQAVFFSGRGTEGAATLWRELHAADPHLMLLGSSATVLAPFTSQLGAAASSTYLATPVLAPRSYNAEGRRVLAAYQRTFGAPGTGYALLGYEAMSVVLDAIRRAGSHGNDRQRVISELLSTQDRESVLGRYSLQPNGETTLTRYGVDRVVGTRPVFYREIDAPRAAP
jgi:branched-chain amino acid transport system substrate-binding protein